MKYLLIGFLSLALAPALTFAQAGDIRSVDFKNFTYGAHCASDKPERITVKNGEYSHEKQEDGYVDRMHFSVFSVQYGDVTADGRDEAIILTVCNTGGTGNFSEGFVYTMKAGRPTLLARIPGGDRAYGGLRDAGVQDGFVVVESNDVGQQGGACCPEFIITTRYRVHAGKLSQTGKTEKRPIYPSQRVTFARGATGTTMKVMIPANEGKQFIIGARAGQMLSVSSDSDKVDLRLVEDAEITQDVGGFSAKLPKGGDYTVRIANYENDPVEITLNIRIR